MGTTRAVSADWYAVRWSVLERDDFTCRYCGQFAPNVILHVDHVLAVCEGGTDDLANLVTACAACNIGKEHYRAATVRKRQRAGQRGARVQGVPSLDPAILAALADHPGGRTARQIATDVQRDRSTVFPVLKRLVASGQVSVARGDAAHGIPHQYHLAEMLAV